MKIKKSEIQTMINEAVDKAFAQLNEGYTAVDAQRDLEIVGSYVWGIPTKECGGERATQKEAVNSYMNFMRRFKSKMELVFG